MKFGEAITLLNAGHPVTRQGWNGKGMFLIRAGGYKVAAEDARPNGIITKEFLQGRGLTHLEILPHIDMWTAQNTYLPGWLASQSDMLADDWMIYVEPPADKPMTFADVVEAEHAKKTTKKTIDPNSLQVETIKNPVSVFGAATVKAEGQPVSYTVNVAKPVRKPRKVAAPYGLKKDGTPKSKPGRKA